MNILILTTHFNPGGLSRYVVNLASALKKQGHNVWVASSPGSWQDKLKSLNIGFKVLPIRTKSILSPRIFLSFLRLRAFLRESNIDVVHCNTRVTQALGALIYRCLRIPYVSAFHGFYRPSFFRQLFKFSGKKAIAVSNAVKKHLTEDLKIKEDKVTVVYNGVDESGFFPEEDKRSAWGFKKEDLLVGILGRVSEEKGHFLAVEAVGRLALKYKNIYLLISGKGKVEASLKAFVKAVELQQRVRFIDCGANEFLSSVDILLVPSRKEGFGYAVVEAFLKGVPVVGYNVGGISEIIKDGRNGVLFYDYDSISLAKAVEKIVVDKGFKEGIVSEAKKDVLLFTAERMAQGTLKVYAQAIKRGS